MAPARWAGNCCAAWTRCWPCCSNGCAEPVSRLSAALMARQRALQQSDLETAARLLHGEIPLLRQEVEALGPAEAALLRLLDRTAGRLGQRPGRWAREPAAGGVIAPDYQRLRDALDTAYIREVSRRLLRWIGDQDQPPGIRSGLAAFCATVHDGSDSIHDGLITGREAGRAAGRLALLGLLERRRRHGTADRGRPALPGGRWRRPGGRRA